MARPATIWFRKQTGWYCTTLGGEQVPLAKDKREAERLFHELMAKRNADDVEAEASAHAGPTFKKLADEYLIATRNDKVARAFQQQVSTLQGFASFLPRRVRAADLKPHMVSAWLRTKTTWGPGTQANARKVIKAVLNWAVREGHLPESPLKKMARGEGGRRDRVLTVEERERIASVVTPDFADFLRALELTGARPFSEMAQVTAADVDFNQSTVTLVEHKNRKKVGKPRTIYVVPELLAMLKARAERYPTGPLFRSRRGGKWSAVSGWKWMDTINKKVGIKAFPYAWRHTYITEALIRGVPVEVVAELVGNTPQVLHKHYAHVGKDASAMRAAALKAVG